MKLKFFLVISLLFVLVSSVFFAAGEPDRFFLRFSDGKMVVVPSTGTKQISAQNMVLSYCTDWEMVQVYPYLFHLRLNTWSGFFWSVNTSRKQVYKVDGGTFGGIGGTHTTLNISVEPVGGSVTVSPERFALNFSGSLPNSVG